MIKGIGFPQLRCLQLSLLMKFFHNPFCPFHLYIFKALVVLENDDNLHSNAYKRCKTTEPWMLPSLCHFFLIHHLLFHHFVESWQH